MKTTTISEEYDTLLEAIAPEHLRGKKLTSRRVEWAIDYLNDLGMFDDQKAEKPGSSTNNTYLGEPPTQGGGE